MPDTIPTLEDDPCGRAVALKAARDEVMTGGGVAEYEHDAGNGVRRRVKYNQANMAMLTSQILEADKHCALKSGNGKSRRFAMVGKRRAF